MRVKNNYLVSIITPCFNNETTIDDTIKSVCIQSYERWELIIIDDCSSDSTAEIVKNWIQKDDRIRLITLNENSGAATARNIGIKAAQGRFIAFLDADDLWLVNKLERQIDYMLLNSIDLTYSAYEKIDIKGTILGKVGVSLMLSYTDLLKKCEIGCLTAVYDTERIGKIYMPIIRKRQDLGLWLSILKVTPYAYGLNEVLAQYRVRSDSISANKRNAAAYTWHLYRNVEKLDWFKSAYYFTHYAVNGMLRTRFPKIAKKLGVLK